MKKVITFLFCATFITDMVCAIQVLQMLFIVQSAATNRRLSFSQYLEESIREWNAGIQNPFNYFYGGHILAMLAIMASMTAIYATTSLIAVHRKKITWNDLPFFSLCNYMGRRNLENKP